MSASDLPAADQALETAAVIGGGPSGASAARALREAGVAVTLFDRGRAAGGRASTRRSRTGVAFDHGSPCFTAHSEAFAERVAGWREAGVVGPWTGRFLRADPGGERDQAAAAGDPAVADGPAVRWRPDPRERFVGVPSMAALVGHLLEGAAEAHAESEIVELLGEPAGRGSAGPWLLKDAAGQEHGPFDAVVVAVAAPQAARLLGASAPRLARLAERAKAAGCFSVMLAFDEPLGLAPAAGDVADGEAPAAVDAVRLDRGPLAWVGRETHKPGRPTGAGECWVLHARPTWSAPRLEQPAEEVIAPLKAALQRLLGRPLPATAYEAAHRWKFAHCVKPLPDASFVSPKHRLAACGDWFGGPEGAGGVEAAVMSGRHAAMTLLEKLQRVPAGG
ncbi:NAD(P)/FAD-dependent oxidoreductase [Phycisphaera mikurensis]|uniref:Putative oxidoreductase n=1 Tax=Phycisphaera mikurensis (strain NBRC 102666 / KCTC 22515 / FYK2301M01) TaxID=1142394 RepID=I0IGC8_PHYMF|nr:NAD(P)-binding protein [Phycisphaera mikurensis]MBB6440306.1 hypothetical protein [Phycisphaera mikurensis]BAM04316.1 putative oxidoreductase [Phycisphaera mikurensis NBRC 102666]